MTGQKNGSTQGVVGGEDTVATFRKAIIGAIVWLGATTLAGCAGSCVRKPAVPPPALAQQEAAEVPAERAAGDIFKDYLESIE